MRWLCRDLCRLAAVAGRWGPIHAGKLALLALRARLMRIADNKWESGLGVKFDRGSALKSLEVASDNKGYGFSYVPTATRSVRVLLNSLPDDLSAFSFIDLGSGEGRALLVASEFPFRQIVGVEFAKELHEAAVVNIARASQISPGMSRVGSIHVDAAQFRIPCSECVLYFHNPSAEPVFQQVMKNVESAYHESGKKLYLLYQQSCADLEENATSNVAYLRAAQFLIERKVRFRTLWDRFLLGSHDLYIFETSP